MTCRPAFSQRSKTAACKPRKSWNQNSNERHSKGEHAFFGWCNLGHSLRRTVVKAHRTPEMLSMQLNFWASLASAQSSKGCSLKDFGARKRLAGIENTPECQQQQSDSTRLEGLNEQRVHVCPGLSGRYEDGCPVQGRQAEPCRPSKSPV
jgi:hypothetical protein